MLGRRESARAGLIFLSLFGGFLGAIMLNCLGVVRSFSSRDPDYSLMGGSLLACMAGALFTIATVSNYLSVPYIYWELAGLAVAYVQVAKCQALALQG